ncbi:MAG TPA: CvpA family protein [Candidatus Limnocylindria bacterium]|nr:CvpA family protein [Candidatus Limnocylindria bacterium]
MADLVIIGAILFGALAGWRKGFVLPLIALGGALLSIAALYAGPLNGIVPSGTAGLGLGAAALFIGGAVLGRVGGALVGLVYRFQILRRIDKVVGIPLGAVTATVAVYVAILGTLALDGWLSPLHGKAAIEVKDIAAVQALAAANPSLGIFADPAVLQAMATAATSSPVAADQLAKFDQTLAFYEQTVRPELLQSRIVPVLLMLGESLPFIGRHAELPTE